MISYEFEDLFKQDSINKQWTITITDTSDGNRREVAVIHNEDMLDDSLKITETISTDGLNFGRCEPNKLEVTVYNVFGKLKGYELVAEVSLDGNEPFLIGTYTIESDTPTADRYHRKIEAYDFLYLINSSDVAPWYDGIQFPITIKNLRDNFFSYLGYEQIEVTLPNDDIQITKTVDSDGGVSGSSVISAICMTNGAFGHVTRDNKFRYILLNEIYPGQYPSDELYPSDSLYPADDVIDYAVPKDEWSNLTFDDFECQPIDGVYVLDSDGEIYASSGECKNAYELKQNFLLYEMENGQSEDNRIRKIRNSIVNTASGFIGRTFDSSNNIIFVTDYYGSPKNKKVNYCCIFVWDIYRMCNAPEYFYGGRKTASCTELLNYYRTYYPDRVHNNLSICKPGDLVFYQFDTDPNAEHVGIFDEASSATTFYAIEGNTSNKSSGGQTNAGYVMRKNRNVNKVLAFVNIGFPEDTVGPTTLQQVCDNLYSRIQGLSYRPFNIEMMANPCVEVGDRIRANSRDKIVYSYCLKRKMTGIQMIMDNMESEGVEYRDETLTASSDDLKRLTTKVRKDAEFNDVKLRTLEASTVSISSHLSAAEADITTLYASDVTINGRLDLTNATVEGLKADTITINNGLKTANKDIVTVTKKANDNAADIVAIKADYITSTTLKSEIGKIEMLETKAIVCDGGIFVNNGTVVVNDRAYATSTLTINGKSYNIVTWSDL